MTIKSTDPKYNEFTSTYGYVTLHIQKDKRITLGTALHLTNDCQHLRGKEPLSISGEAARRIPVCGTCATYSK